MSKKNSMYCVVCNKEILRETYCNFHYNCLSIKDRKRIKPYKKPETIIITEKAEIVRFSYDPAETTVYI